MNILTLGDIHGRKIWKKLTHGTYKKYDEWREAVDNGTFIASDDKWKKIPYLNYDLVIFIGDYVDSFDIPEGEILYELQDIIHFKKAEKDRVKLLIGNHDISYIIAGQECSGFKAAMKHSYESVFRENIALFDFAYGITDNDGYYWLWTHAGVTANWLDLLIQDLSRPDNRFKDYISDLEKAMDNTSVNKWDVHNLLQLAWSIKNPILYYCDSFSGGVNSYAGPIWVRPHILGTDQLFKVNQIVGHTPQKDVIVKDYPAMDAKTYYIDCLEYGSGKACEIEINVD